MHANTLVDINQLSERLGVKTRTIRSWQHLRKIPFFKIAHKTLLFDEKKVRAALEAFEVKAVTK
jgi:hypothetical protein